MINLWGDDNFATLQADLTERLLKWLVQTGDVPPMKTDSRFLPKFPSIINDASCDAAMSPVNRQERTQARGNPPLSNELDINGIPHFIY
jgi:hypothetical protein